MLSLVGGDLESPWNRLHAVKDMGDRWLQADSTRSNEPNSVLEVRKGTDVGKQVAQAALPEEVHIELQRAAKPRHPDDFSSRTDAFHGLKESPMAGKALLWASAGAVHHDIGAVPARQLADGGDRVALHGVDDVISPELPRDPASLFAHIHGDQDASAAQPGDLKALQPHAPLSK